MAAEQSQQEDMMAKAQRTASHARLLLSTSQELLRHAMSIRLARDLSFSRALSCPCVTIIAYAHSHGQH